MAVIDHAVSSPSEDSSPEFNHHDHHGSQGQGACDGRDDGDGQFPMVSRPEEAHSPATEDATQDAQASAEDDLEAADQAVMLEGLPQVIADALKRLPEDVGALLETPVIEALAELKAGDLAGYVRVRHMAKGLNKGVLLGLLDKAVQAQLPHGDADPSAIDELVGLARETGRFVHDADRKAYAILPVLGHTEVWPVMSSGFEEWLRALYWRHCERGVPETTLKSALATLAAAGLNDGDEVEVHWRATQHGDGYLIDLCDEHWRAVEVGAWGWRVLTPSPAYFTRTAAMRALPEPDTAHADLGLLWQYANVPSEQRLMVVAWLLECFRPETPFPVLELVGEQGSAKSTTQTVLRSLIDPNKVALRGRPKTVEDIFVAGANNWVISYENLSGLTAEQQDALCTLATGGGFASRQLYTNGEESILSTKRPVILNGIAVVATRPDLIDRVVHIDMPTIAPAQRRDEADTQAGWERDRPRVFAALLDLFSAALAILPSVTLTHKQRMADFERLGEAVARALGFAAGEFQQRYAQMVRAGVDRALESNAVAQALEKYLGERVLPWHWQGTAGQLYDLLNLHAVTDRSSWPRSPKGLADQLRRIAPAYRSKGIDITPMGHGRDGALWRISTQHPSTDATPPSVTPTSVGGIRYGAHRE